MQQCPLCRDTKHILSENVWAMKSMDLSLGEIANHFNVSKQAIWYILQSDDKKKEINIKRHLRDSKDDKMKANIASAKARKYKRKVLETEMKKVQKINSEEWRKNHPEYNATSMKKHYYKEKINDKWYGAIERQSYRPK